jgi:methylmalonyl-CoA/ethylmalonyl-CoA epimerase
LKINKVDHISIAVKDQDQVRRIWEPVLGKTGQDDTYIDESEKIKVAYFKTAWRYHHPISGNH